MRRVRRLSEPRGWAVATAATILKSILLPLTSREWIDGTKIPADGGCLVVINHNSHLDPLTSAHFVYDHGRVPRFLAKSSLFSLPIVGAILDSAGQIPVERLTRNAVGAYDAAVQAVLDGRCVVVYPEGTLTRDPALWPMKGKSGAARIALATGCPVIPVGQWGAQDVLAPYAKTPRPWPRKRVVMKAGDPVDLQAFTDREDTPVLVAAVTEKIMSAITALVAEIRQETPPEERFDPRRAGVREIGDPNDPPQTRGTHQEES